MKKIFAAILVSFSLLLGGCTFISTGEVGLRVNYDRTVNTTELMPGSLNQVIVGDVLKFPVKEVSVDVKNLTPLAADNSTMKDVDLTVIYNIDPTAVSDFWVNKSRGFHYTTEEGQTLLMHSYIYQTARNAMYKVSRQYEALAMNDYRAAIETQIHELMVKTIKDEKMDGITISQIRVTNLIPSDAVKKSADDLVKAQNDNKRKSVEVEIAKKEADRIAALNQNSSSIAYIQAQALQEIASGIREGKVNTVVVPYDFRGIINVK